MSDAYKGDVTVQECWSSLEGETDAFLVDVRTLAEWNYVGFPVLPEGRHPPVFQEWQSFPSMKVDPNFTARLSDEIERAGGSRASKLFFLCRSGVRSQASAAAMTALGFGECYNILDGFEGPPDEEGHRGRKAGWKAEGLPWAQK